MSCILPTKYLPLVVRALLDRACRHQTNYIYSLAFSPDGKSLVSGSGDRTVRTWDTELPARRQQARREAETLRPNAELLVERLLREKKDAAEVATAVRGSVTQRAPAESGLTCRDENVRAKVSNREPLETESRLAGRGDPVALSRGPSSSRW